MRYLPYGGSRDAGTNLQTDHLFTSQVLDASIGLYWYNSRAYDPVLGRFLVPDTIVPNAMNPQSLNRYSYGRNNPLRYTDPSGHDEEDWFSEDWKQAFRDSHDGADPTDSDYADRYSSMAEASGYENTEAPEWVAAAAGGDGGGGGGDGGSTPSEPTGVADPPAASDVVNTTAASGDESGPKDAGGLLADALSPEPADIGSAVLSTAGRTKEAIVEPFSRSGARLFGKINIATGAIYDGFSGYETELGKDGGHSRERAAMVGIGTAAGGAAAPILADLALVAAAGALGVGTGGIGFIAIALVVGVGAGWAGSHTGTGVSRLVLNSFGVR
ncbi:MAG: RHS repeat-associated core domain-containing protein [Chloroflexota bacterium]|nr:MAG: RHS repeat-associated core domain-containing protein [Chloroflexota bacterium]